MTSQFMQNLLIFISLRARKAENSSRENTLLCYHKYSCNWMINLIFQEKLLIPINNHMLYVVWEERARSINRKKSDAKFEDRNNCFWCNCFPGSCAGLLKSRLHESSLQITPQEKKKKKHNTGQCKTEQEVTSVNLQRNFVTLPRSQRRITIIH